MNGRRIQQKSHLNAAGFAQRAEMGTGICTLLQESAKDGEKRSELTHKKKWYHEQVNVLITNILHAPTKKGYNL